MLQTRAVFLSDVIASAPSSYLRLTVTADDCIISAGVLETKASENRWSCVEVAGAAAARPVGER